MKKITSVREIVTAFGGTGKCAAFLKVVPSAVSNMLHANEIPRAYHLEILAELDENGHEIDLERVFGVRWQPKMLCKNSCDSACV